MPASAILRSYQVFGADDQVLTAAVDAVKKAIKDSKSQGKVQRVALHRRGYRNDIEVGDIFVVPTSVCNDPEDFPTILLSANLRKHTTGEGMVEFQMGSLVDPKELSRETLQEFKKICFTNSKGDSAPLIVFAAAWAHPSAYQSFAYEEDQLLPNLRETAYASPFNPSLSAVFDQLRAVDPDSAPAAKITPSTQHIYTVPKSEDQDYPEFAKGLDIADEDGSKKKASLTKRATIRLRAAEIPKLEKESLTDDELSMFDAVSDQVQQAVKKGGAIPPSTPATFAPQSGSTTEPKTVAEVAVPVVDIKSLDTAAFATPGEQPGAYVEPQQDTRHPGVNLELGEEGTMAERTPDLVDGANPKTAAAHDDVVFILQIPAGEKKVFSIKGQQYTVYFDSQTAQGDSGAEVPGMISGEYEVWVGQEPNLKNLLRQHVSPGKPGGMQQVYAAEKVVNAILTYANNQRTAGGHYAYKVDGGIICSACAKKKGITTGAVNANSMAVHDTTCKECGKTMSPAAKGFKDIREVAPKRATVESSDTLEVKCDPTKREDLIKQKEHYEGTAPKKAAFAADTVQAVNKFIEHWAGRILSEEGLKSELMKCTNKLKDAVIFMRDQGNLVPYGQGSYKVLNSDLKVQEQNPPKLSFVLRNASKQVWAATMVDGLSFGGEWVKDKIAATRYATKKAAGDEIRRHMLASEAIVTAKDCSCEGDCDCRVTAAKTAGNWFNPGTVIEQFYPQLQHNQVDSPFIEQTQGPVINPFGAPGKEAPTDPNAMGLSQGLDENAGGTPLRQETGFYGPEYARNFYAPHADIPGNALKLKKHPLAAGAKKEDHGKRRLIHTEGDVKVYWNSDWNEYQCIPAGNEKGSYHTDDKQDALDSAKAMAKKTASDVDTEMRKIRQQLADLPDGSPEIPKLQKQIQDLKDKAGYSGKAGPSGESEEKRRGLSIASVKQAMPKEVPKPEDEEKAPWMKMDSRDDDEVLGTSKKKADASMALFQGLTMAPAEEEHPQAHVDETAQAGIPTPYNEPVKEDSVEQDATFLSMDKLLKGVVAAYAAQLIAAFQVTSKPLSLDAPYKDKLDLHMTLEVAGGVNSNAAQADAAKAQYDQAMSNLNDDQKQMLVKQAIAQAAVWCPNAEGSGGFNYEVFVRAESLNGPTLEIVVVTGTK